jgi:hypothetical protein
MSDTLLVALVGFLAAIVGGMIQAWTARRFETARFERHNRNQAYLAYFKGIGEISFAAGDDRATQVAHGNIAEARSRIALTGSEQVIDAMNAVFENGADTHSPKARADLANLLKAMRDDSTGGPSIAEADKLFRLAFGDGPRKEIQ